MITALPGGALIGVGIMQSNVVLGIGGAILLMLLVFPTLIYVGLGLAFGDHAVALDNAGPTEALEKSWGLASGNRLHLFLFLFVYGIARLALAIAGLMMLCIGALFTVPISRAVTDVGFTEGYLLLTGHTASAEVFD